MSRSSRADERGFALVAVLLVLAILGIIGTEFAFSMRLEAAAVRAYKDTIIGTHLAEAAVQQAIREIVADYNFVGLREGRLTFFDKDGNPREPLPRQKVPLGSGAFSYTISDEEARINVNMATAERMDKLLQCRGMDKGDRDVIVDSIQDWRDTNEEHRLNGAESEDTYLKLPVPYRSHNTNLASIRELLQIKGITPALFYGADNQPGLVDDVTVKTLAQININTTGARVLCALGLSQAEIGTIEQTRQDAINRVVPGQFGGRQLAVTSRTFRIEAEGLVDGRVGARILAVVQKRRSPSGPAVAVLEWQVGR